MSSLDRKICRNNTKIITELRNSVYEFLTAEYEGRVRRFTANSFSHGAGSTPASILSPAHVCQKLRKEFLSHFFAMFEVGLDWLDVDLFCHTVCSTFSNGEWLSSRAPKSITVYIDETICNEPPIQKPKFGCGSSTADEIAAEMAAVWQGIVQVRRPRRVLHPSLNLLPLLQMRLLRRDFVCLFVLDPKVDWDAVKEKYNSEDTLTDERVTTAAQDLAQLMVFGNEPWTQCMERKLDEVLLHPWSDWTDLQIELVFKEQPNEFMTLHSKTRRCYLPDLRGAGLREFYATTGLTFNMSMVSSTPKPDWEESPRLR